MFKKNNSVFFSLGGQLHNSSMYNLQDLDKAFAALKVIHANTLAAPITWESFEPQENVFDYSPVDFLLSKARESGFKLILLWFGSWKNGCSRFIPEWIKKDRQRFDFVQNATGNILPVLTPLSLTNLAADQKALAKLAFYLKQKDAKEQTVIGLQIQNEPGIMGSDRDYGTTAEKAFQDRIPQDLQNIIQDTTHSWLNDLWMKQGSPQGENWEKSFGLEAEEYFTAYHTATYVNTMARAVRQIYDIPLYTNVWLREMVWRIPGVSYPSGGATSNVIDLWKALTPDLDCIAPDIYVNKASLIEEVAQHYQRPDNPLYIPETLPGANMAAKMFYLASQPNCVGFHCFGLDSIVNAQLQMNQGFCGEFADSMKALSHALPLLENRPRVKQFYAVDQEQHVGYDWVDFGDYIGLVRYFMVHLPTKKIDPTLAWLDTFHSIIEPETISTLTTSGRGLIAYMGQGEFYLTGCGYRLLLIEKTKAAKQLAFQGNEFLLTRLGNYLSVEEGGLESNLKWTCKRKRNGDETDNGVWVQPNVGLVRIQMNQQ